ncbi:transporter substrate-binding domain-containing protein [Neobacillus cucumis]|uniref:transporter substrate-binding domain-containing protein n=1 Tax=Neobacillus cucumis TaxID=1740721 RepID=UPI0018DF2779|nr:transporter substrate-binding domain-containing protein [Neobacillus cucumis]MBI0581331.1 transporter substrate-binding domain-containing protein [Neobacillus cucumis]
MRTPIIFRICVTIPVLLLSFVLFPFTAYQESNKVIRIAGDNKFPPFEYLSGSGVYTGFNVDVMNAISIQTGIKIEYYPMPWNQALKALKSGKVDAIQGMKDSPSRRKTYAFSNDYFISSQAIFVLKNNMYIRQMDDLEGKKVAVQKSDVSNDLLNKVKNVHLIKTDNQQAAVQLLLEGKADAFVGNRITGQYVLQKSGKQSYIKIVGDEINPTSYSIAVLPKNKALLTIFNKGLSQIKKDGTYEKIVKKWFGEYIMPSAPRLQKVIKYLEVGLFVTIIIITAVLWWNRILKRKVASRTSQIERMNKKLEEKMVLLQENNNFQQQLLNSTLSSFVTLDNRGHISMINRKAIDYLKLHEDIVGLPFTQTILEDFISKEEIQNALEKKEIVLQKEVTWEHVASLKRILTYSIYPIVSTTGNSKGAVLNFQDITKQKEFEKKVAQEDRLRSLGQLMMGIAHEIRNPLMSILTYTQLLPKKYENLEFRTFFSQHVTSEITRLNSLINDLLDYSRPKKSEPVLFFLYPMIQSTLQLFKQKIKEKKLGIVFEMDEDLQAYADAQQMKQVLVNIILNAIEALKEQGNLTIRGYYQGESAVIEIEDNGIGMSDEVASKIFDPFYSKKVNGVGLGLFVSYQLLEENQCSIKVESTKGKGTVMTLYLPCPREGREENA